MEVVFNFGGFYGSNYSDEIDSVIYDEDEDNHIDSDSIDFKALHIAVAKQITEQFNVFLNEEFDLEINFKFNSLESPTFYNYCTDTIILDISNEDKIKLDILVDNDSEIHNYLDKAINDVTTYKDGYVPFFNYDDVKAKINDENEEVYYQTLLDSLIKLKNKEYCIITLDSLNDTISSNL
tara:strand:- start:68 stop:607 length:540 start_codon:yes stop_codon:yes gene_type:complete